jgi:hypothetical protein
MMRTLAVFFLVTSGASAWAAEDCDALYKGEGTPRDFSKALACYRAQGDWIMVAIMQVNGEGTPVDLAGARATLRRVESKDADSEALESIIAKREANPSAKGRRVDFCKDVAMTTLSANSCEAEAEEKTTAKSDAGLKKMRAGLDARVRAAFDRAQAAFEKFVKAEGERVYQENIDGSIRNQAAMDQQAQVRRNFMATINVLIGGPADRLVGRRTFGEADKALNAVYNANLSSYVKFNEESAADARNRKDAEMAATFQTRITDYKAKSRAAQHEWVRYRDAMGSLAAARWPGAREVQDQARALVTEDRIRELNGK